MFRRWMVLILMFTFGCGGTTTPDTEDEVVIITDDGDDGGASTTMIDTEDTADADNETDTPGTTAECGPCEAPVPACDGDTAVSYDVRCVDGSCVLGDAHRTDCTEADEVCVQGACVDAEEPCANRTCPAPRSRCVGSMLEEPVGTPTCEPDTGQCTEVEFSRSDCRDQGMICVDARCIEPRKRIFVTAGEYTGDLATAGGETYGLEGADSICQTEANAQNLGGTWKAWISTSLTDAADRVEDVGPWYFVDNRQRVAHNLAEFVTSGPERAIEMTPDGTVINAPRGERVWTGTRANGRFTESTCRDWTSESDTYWGWAGFTDTTNTAWTEGLDYGCDGTYRLYCLEQ